MCIDDEETNEQSTSFDFSKKKQEEASLPSKKHRFKHEPKKGMHVFMFLFYLDRLYNSNKNYNFIEIHFIDDDNDDTINTKKPKLEPSTTLETSEYFSKKKIEFSFSK